ncbi:MAG: DUF2333 family protein [Gammaproteobacteria bacterium]
MQKYIGTGIGLFILLMLALMFYWDTEPDSFDVSEAVTARLGVDNQEKVVTGYTTTSTLIEVTETLLNKRGGYLSNDIMPPSLFMDNIPNWEFGVLVQVRDMARVLRNDLSRSQTTSTEDKDLMNAEPQLHFDSESWMLPATETEYKSGLKSLKKYLSRLQDSVDQDAQFYARSDNLREWLSLVEKRLGSLSQRLSASVGQVRINTDLQGDSDATQATPSETIQEIKTPWLEIDDVFYEARGTAWALAHLMHAMAIDFDQVLKKKNAVISMRQIIRELEATQEFIWSPMILNGTGFGFTANHSLVMGSYISRANAAIIDLRDLLKQG